ncbi:MAG: molybdenum cofactor guanylyltransferase [Phycisphaerales bacterium]|jgi:molybdopterin-guanine dinucleotide biosynthesis protein A|nr:molybdenum cofactor guanylyltransferase [Phycisphaerales bacterium]
MTEVTLAILAGGEGARMGTPKGELRIGDEPILAYLLRTMDWRGSTMLVTAPGREHPPGWERFDREVVDPVGGQGPLRGVLTALENATTLIVAVTTVDMPNVRAADLQWLIARLADAPDAMGLMLRRGAEIEPFPGAYWTAAAGAIRAQLDTNRLSVRALADQTGFATLPAPRDWDEQEVWTNLNRPEDLAAFLKRRSYRADQ